MGRIKRLLESLERVLALSESVLGEMAPRVLGPGEYASHRAFRWQRGVSGGHLVAIPDPVAFDLDDLIGVERSLEALERNTRQFLAGLPFNNVLLHGERGTGKSSAMAVSRLWNWTARTSHSCPECLPLWVAVRVTVF